MNKKGFIDLDFLAEIHPLAYVLAIAGAVLAFYYVPYLGTGAGLLTQLGSAVLTFIAGTIIAHMILSN